MHILGFIRKEVAKKVQQRERKLQGARKDRIAANNLRSQTQLSGFRVRIAGKLGNSENVSTRPIEVAVSGSMSFAIYFAVTRFMSQNKNEPAPTSSMITVEAVLPNQTLINLPEKFWKKYLKTS